MTLPFSRALSAALMSTSKRSQVLGLVIEMRGTPMPTECKLEQKDWAHDEELGWFLKDTRQNLYSYEFGTPMVDGDEGEGISGERECQKEHA